MANGGDGQVACYKICTVKLNRTQQTDDDDDAAVTLDSEEAMVRSVMRDGSQDSLSQRCGQWHGAVSVVEHALCTCMSL